MTTASRPVPVPDELSAPYWSAAARHELTLARCSVCRRFALPPTPICPNCHSTAPEYRYEPSAGRGIVRSWTILHQSFLPGFDDLLPFVLVDVELSEQAELRMIGRLLDGAGPSLALGSAVAVAFEDIAPGVAVPAFRLEDPR